MVQEYVKGKQHGGRVSEEYKIHMFADRVAAFEVVDRTNRKSNLTTFFTDEWQLIGEDMLVGQCHGVYREPATWLDEMINVAKKMGAELGTYARLDFMLRDSEFFFGELTFTPTAGRLFTAFSNQYFENYWQETCPGNL